ncbi:hypothetical protein [Pseudomonas lactis]|uniref:hypothetical protein n=1 Tax=Pseudomonas lactis TaxID=1615674 RepID=UPI0014728E94|nr:hypothetical protein [Pseudomonas lactis]NNA48575.1 hypothetical protein [Pseudomonas lactis]
MPEINERPILFSAPMVRAILEGRKTVTRRAVKPVRGYEEFSNCRPDKAAASHAVWWHGRFETVGTMQYCPYGKPGDRLWVHETWVADAQVDAVAPRNLSQGEPIQYPADGDVRQTGCAMIKPGKIRPSIHMPRWVSRILLEITDVGVERLQDISRADIRAEGLLCPPKLASDDVSPNYRDWYPVAWRELWESTGGDWDTNPWVWVVEFKRVTP